MKSLFAISLLLALTVRGVAATEPSPAEMISDFRLKHGEGRVTIDATLNQIASEQAKAMAAKDTLDHEVLGSFNSRIAPSKSGRAAENIAYGYDSFEKTLGQWINSPSHRTNLLLHNASRVGIASARNAGSRRTYWAMEIAGDYDLPRTFPGKKTAPGKRAPAAAGKETPARSCHVKILGLCL
jgi:uncharacterized protein YkwD